MRDIIAAAREAALQQVYLTLSQSLTTAQAEEITALLVTPASEVGRNDGDPRPRSRLEQLKTMPRKESPEALLTPLERLTEIRSLGLTALRAMADVYPATRRMLASWGYRYDVWSLRRFTSIKRDAIRPIASGARHSPPRAVFAVVREYGAPWEPPRRERLL